MKRRGFLQLLGLATAAGALIKEALAASPHGATKTQFGTNGQRYMSPRAVADLTKGLMS